MSKRYPIHGLHSMHMPHDDPISKWARNPAHSGAVLSALIEGLKKTGDTKSLRMGAAYGTAWLVGECVACHAGRAIIFDKSDAEIKNAVPYADDDDDDGNGPCP